MKSYFLKELKYQFKQLWQRWAKALGQCAIALLISIGSIFFWASTTGQKFDLWVLKQFFEIRGTLPAPKDVVIIGIDDLSYQQLEASTRLPFPRLYVAKALQQIVSASPKVVIIDANIPKEKVDEEADQILEDALRAGPTTIWSGIIGKSAKDLQEDPNANIILSSESRFREAAKMELPMLVTGRFGIVSSITYEQTKSQRLYDIIPLSRPLIELGKYEIVAPESNDLINYYGPNGTIKRFSLYQLLNGPVAEVKAQLKDKVVLFGFQSIGRGRGQIDKDEYYISASDDSMFGVEIHANIVGNLLDRTWLKRQSIPTELSILYVFALIIGIVGIAFTPEKGVPLIIVIVGLTLSFGYWSFVSQNVWYAGLGTLIFTAGLTILGNLIYHYVIIKSFKKYIKKTFKFDIERKL